jgi:crossover junction endodeoxyribonuclease RuvC
MLKCVGVDPGLADTGVGVVTGFGLDIERYSFGAIQTSKSLSLPERLDMIFSRLLNVLKDEKPDLMVVEDVYSLEKFPKSGITLGKVTGVILLAGFRSGVPVVEIPVREAKKILTGNGNAGKDQLEKAVRHILSHPERIQPNHASDALALAVIGQYRYSNQHAGT